MTYPNWEDVPVQPGVHKFDPDTRFTRENSRGMIGWPGSFPRTPCRNCGGEYFRWVGDWNLGFSCVSCRRTWVAPKSEV